MWMYKPINTQPSKMNQFIGASEIKMTTLQMGTDGGECWDGGRGRGVEGDDVQVGGDRERGKGWVQ